MGLLHTAYKLDEFRIVGLPAWANSERFDITAKAADGNATASGYARFDDLSPNGSVLTEYAPVSCAGGCPSAPSDTLVSYTWSKSTDIGSGYFNVENGPGGGSTVQNYFDSSTARW